MSVKRYIRDYSDMSEYEHGNWVKFSDHQSQLAAIKEENEAFRQERKDLIGELHRLALVEQSFKARVAELEGASEALRSSLENAAAMLSGAIRDGRLSEIDRIAFSDKRKMELSEMLDFANEILGATLKEPANEG